MTEGFRLDLGLIGYEDAFAVQDRIVFGRVRRGLPPVVVLQENHPVFTIGRGATRENILAPPETLQRLGISVVKVNRGGDITYHGPGQLIASPVLRLEEIGLNANEYMHSLEDLLIELLNGYGVAAEKKELYPGVWWNGRKIAAVGIAVRRGVAFHGFSLNLKLDCAPFELINPCGVPQMPVVSLHQILDNPPDFESVKRDLCAAVERRYRHRLRDITRSELERMEAS